MVSRGEVGGIAGPRDIQPRHLRRTAGQQMLLDDGYLVGRRGIKSKYPEFPRPIYDIKGAIPMDWRKVTTKDRENAREEFKRLVIEKN